MLAPSTPPIDFQNGALLLVDKPLGWTSFDVVNKIRYALRKAYQRKKFKVGHAGTLDPMATGLLLICTGKWTKRLESLTGLPKTYTGSFALGATTPSFDLETEIDERYETDHIDQDVLEQARLALSGPIEQMPPIYSAIKVDGQPLYKRARKGENVEVKPRSVVIEDFRLGKVSGLPQVGTTAGPDPIGPIPDSADPDSASEGLPRVDFLVSCSKGTYIRSLAYDFGRLVGSGAHLRSLCRTSIGPYELEEAWELGVLIDHIDQLDIKPE